MRDKIPTPAQVGMTKPDHMAAVRSLVIEHMEACGNEITFRTCWDDTDYIQLLDDMRAAGWVVGYTKVGNKMTITWQAGA